MAVDRLPGTFTSAQRQQASSHPRENYETFQIIVEALGRLAASARLHRCLADFAPGVLSCTEPSAGETTGQGSTYGSANACRVVPFPPLPKERAA